MPLRLPFRHRDPGVVVYTTPGCSACAAVKRLLESRGVPFRERDVSRDPAHLREMTRLSGVRVAPVTVIDGEAFYGTFEQQRPKLLAALAARDTPSSRG